MPEAPDHGPAALLRRWDPVLHATAMFAREPARSRLMVLYAFDVELSRAVQAARQPETGPLIAQMRLQWWRDVVDAAFAGEPPRPHDVAEPLHRLIAGGGLKRSAFGLLIDGYALEIAPTFGETEFGSWVSRRFGARTALAVRASGGRWARASRPMQKVLGYAFALRNAGAMARHRASLLPGLTVTERSDLGSGRCPAPLSERIRAWAETGLQALADARASRPRPDAASLPVYLAAWEAEKLLKAAARSPGRAAEGWPSPNPAKRAAALSMKALTGRW